MRFSLPRFWSFPFFRMPKLWLMLNIVDELNSVGFETCGSQTRSCRLSFGKATSPHRVRRSSFSGSSVASRKFSSVSFSCRRFSQQKRTAICKTGQKSGLRKLTSKVLSAILSGKKRVRSTQQPQSSSIKRGQFMYLLWHNPTKGAMFAIQRQGALCQHMKGLKWSWKKLPDGNPPTNPYLPGANEQKTLT